MTDRWFEDLPEHDPDDPAAVERALRRQERANSRRKRADAGTRTGLADSSRGTVDAGDGDGGLDPAGPDAGTYGTPFPRSASSSGRDQRVGTSRRGRGTGSSGRKGLIAVIAGSAVIGVAIIVFLFALFQPFAGDGDGEPFNLTVPRGASVNQVGDLLAENGVVSNATLFRLRAKLSGKDSQILEGDHRFRKNMSYAAALDQLTVEAVTRKSIMTIPEGLSRSETAGRLAADGIPGDYMADSVKSKLLDPQKYGAQGRARDLEGFLFPATYELKPGSNALDLVDQQLEAFRQNIGSVNMKYARKKNLTTYDVLIIASMIEREVSVPKERRKVAAVIYNRLKQGEPLGIDATIRFAVDDWENPLTESDLAVDSPYNTRTNAGLPPGPIGSPGLASIRAAANPARIDSLFYVVKPGTCGEHVFSDTLEQFNRDAEAYRQAQEQAGGSPTDCG